MVLAQKVVDEAIKRSLGEAPEYVCHSSLGWVCSRLYARATSG